MIAEQAMNGFTDGFMRSQAGSLLVVTEDAMVAVETAASALGALVFMASEVSNKVIGHPNKDDSLCLPADGLASLLTIVQQHMRPIKQYDTLHRARAAQT